MTDQTVPESPAVPPTPPERISSLDDLAAACTAAGLRKVGPGVWWAEHFKVEANRGADGRFWGVDVELHIDDPDAHEDDEILWEVSYGVGVPAAVLVSAFAAAGAVPDTPTADDIDRATSRALARCVAGISEVLGMSEDAEAADVAARVRALVVGEGVAQPDGWAGLPTPEDVAAEMSRRMAGSDTAARRESLVMTAARAIDAVAVLREKGQTR